MIAPVQYTMLAFTGELVGRIDTTIAQDAASHMQLYIGTQVVTVKSSPREFITSTRFTVAITEVLQVAFTCLVTYGAIKGVVDKQHFHDTIPCIDHFFRCDVLHFHSLHHRCAATGNEFRHGPWILFRTFAYFHQACPA